MTTLVWFRHDLRLADQPALLHTCRGGGPVVPVFVWSPEEEGVWSPGAASRWWLHHSLAALSGLLERRGSRLIVRSGPTLETLRAVAHETGATAVVWNRRYEPAVVARDRGIKAGLAADGLAVRSFNAALIREPWQIRQPDGSAFRSFTAFSIGHGRRGGPIREPLPAPLAVPAPAVWPVSLPLEALDLLPRRSWADDWLGLWNPGEVGAWQRCQAWHAQFDGRYRSRRHRPADPATSRLSPHLHFGEIGPRQLWHALPPDAAFRRELLWREFTHHLLYHFPHMAEKPLRRAWRDAPVRHDSAELRRWQHGRTGYPLVDAGMRELWATGYMHNRVRMVTASFLTRDLLHSWRDGAAWFHDTLVDADVANNCYGWQWSAGCGTDRTTFPRVFNPTLQGQRFDEAGIYVRRWVPELSQLPNEYVHRPWAAPDSLLRRAGVEPGVTYPNPMVDHVVARRRALAAWHAVVGPRELDLFTPLA